MGQTVQVSDQIILGNDRPFVLMAGMNVLESRSLAMTVCETFCTITAELDIPFVFKASFDKANRSSIHSFRGPGLEEGLRLLEEVRRTFDVPVLTDIHEPEQAAPVADVADIIQIPAFLARQTDLVVAAARTGRPVNVKKPQFLAPDEMRHILKKLTESGNDKGMLCERGSCFGYNNLVVDMLGMDRMRTLAPVVFDVTHALQKPGGLSSGADGRGGQALALARSGMALGLAGLFLEAHPKPDEARCDGPCALPLDRVAPFLRQVKAVDQLIKSQPPLDLS
ncbi:3-deoxy-8-phosphooctulonate synthase [Yunchengibacter salinarum]|uniref:3-deoxy-8-phosphooctulonate synthase n=1 Tax=Yunchengibacter salinarum TaxID=3133399 RepID=UPI0035B5FDCE